jgi:uncharacterized lipoprotein YmbA
MSLRAWPILAIALLLAGCGSEPDDCAAATPTDNAPTKAEQLAVDVMAADEIELVDHDDVDAVLADPGDVAFQSQMAYEMQRETLLNVGVLEQTSGECEPKGDNGDGLWTCDIEYEDVTVTWQVTVTSGNGTLYRYSFVAMTAVLRADAVYAKFREGYRAKDEPRCDDMPEMVALDTEADSGYRCGAFNDSDECGPPRWHSFAVVPSVDGGISFERL